MAWTLVIVVLSIVGTSFAAPSNDQIESLPGLHTSINFKQYSGYINVDRADDRNLFYWFVESQNNPSADPVVLWMNGGPGCSSLLGLMTEHGPFVVGEDASTLSINPFSWNRVANVIYLEAPAGVGYSYAQSGGYITGDNRTATDNFAFVKGFFEAYPEFKPNPFYVAGESYAGHYVPQLAEKIFDSPSAGINLKGFLAGNPSFEFFNDANRYYEFMTLHAFVSLTDFAEAKQVCNNTFIGKVPPACEQVLAPIREQLIGLNPYDVEGKCVTKPSLDGGCWTMDAAAAVSAVSGTQAAFAGGELYLPELRSQTIVPCINVTAQVDYFRRADVRKALHVSPLAFEWDVCSSHISYNYYAPTMAPLYQKLRAGLDILVFSGDVDSCVPFVGTQVNMDALGLPVEKSWRRWNVTEQVAGYVREYKSTHRLEYATIRDAGHMCATYQPERTFAMFERFTSGRPL